MTATPIPRTLSLTAYGDLDATTIASCPRAAAVKTWVVGEEKRAGATPSSAIAWRGSPGLRRLPARRRLGEAAGEGGGREAERLRRGELSDSFGSASCTGQMSSREKAQAMEEFVAGRLVVLVATTVIEVGIDVPNATVMLIEGAERFGLSQLHQLRGGSDAGPTRASASCSRRSRASSQSADGGDRAHRRRVRAGEVDLTLRGEGEILGTLQHGLPRYGSPSCGGRRAACAARARWSRCSRLREPGGSRARAVPRRGAGRSVTNARRGSRLEQLRRLLRFASSPSGRSADADSRWKARGAQAALAAGGGRAMCGDRLRPCPRDALLGARRRLGPECPRPVLRHGSAGLRGNLARAGTRRCSSTAPRARRPQRGGARDRQPLRGRPQRRRPLPRAQRGTVWPRLLRPAV